MLERIAADSTRTDQERAEAFYNLGNAQFKQEKYPEALESYKNSLRMNPADQEAKYNYAYTKRLLQNSRTRIKTKIRTRTSRTAAVRIRIKTKTRIIIRTKTGSRTRAASNRINKTGRTVRMIPTRTDKIPTNSRRIPTSRTATTGSPANPAKTASPRKNRNGCWMRSRPRRTRPRRNSRRKPGSWYAAIKLVTNQF